MPSKLPDWTGRTAVILASGPSLRSFIRGGSLPDHVKTITTNSTIFAYPKADVAFGLDFMWWKVHQAATRRDSEAACWTTDRTAAERFGLNFVRGANETGLHPKRVNSNGNSGFAAINFAALCGAKRILLLGFDMALGVEGQKHWHPEHSRPCVQAQCFGDWIHRSAALARGCEKAGVSVVNCSTRTALTCFPIMELEEALCPAR